MIQGLRPLVVCRQAFVPQAPHHSKKNLARTSLKNRLARWHIPLIRLTFLTKAVEWQLFRHGRWKNNQNHDNQNQEKTPTGRTVFLRFYFVPASSSDGGGFAVWWVMAVRGVASHKPSSNNGKGRSPLTMAQRVFLVLVIQLRTKTTGFIGWAIMSPLEKVILP